MVIPTGDAGPWDGDHTIPVPRPSSGDWLSRLHDHVDQRHVAPLNLRDRAVDRRSQLVRVLDRALGVAAEAAGQGGEVGRRVAHAHPDPGVLFGTVADLGDQLLVLLVVVVRVVVAYEAEQRQLVVHGGPQRLWGHQEVAVADHGDGQLAGVLVGQRHADRAARAVAQAAATALAAVLAWLVELPDARREAIGAAECQHPVLVLDGVVDLAHHAA